MIKFAASQMDELTIAESSEEKKKLDMLFMDTPVSRLHVFDAVSRIACYRTNAVYLTDFVS